MNIFRRLDHSVARVESALAVIVLLAMVLVASAQALFFNIAERDVAWAQNLLDGISWADAFLQKGTLWLAFLGASLATRQEKHIAIDVLAKLAKPRTQILLRCWASLGAGIIAFVLAHVFFQACLVADASVPFEYEVLVAGEPTHVCDASPAALGDASRPAFLCTARAALSSVGITVASLGGIAQLVVPLLFLIMGVRLLCRALVAGVSWGSGGEGSPQAPASKPDLVEDEPPRDS